LRNRHTYLDDAKNVETPESAGDVKRLLADSMADIRAGKMDPKLGITERVEDENGAESP
jgi:hypothetical protein